LKAFIMMGFGFKFQFILHMCLMMKLVDYVSSMNNDDVDSLIDKNYFWTLWIVGLVWLCIWNWNDICNIWIIDSYVIILVEMKPVYWELKGNLNTMVTYVSVW